MIIIVGIVSTILLSSSLVVLPAATAANAQLPKEQPEQEQKFFMIMKIHNPTGGGILLNS
jgi:hypothetical protein